MRTEVRIWKMLYLTGRNIHHLHYDFMNYIA